MPAAFTRLPKSSLNQLNLFILGTITVFTKVSESSLNYMNLTRTHKLS